MANDTVGRSGCTSGSKFNEVVLVKGRSHGRRLVLSGLFGCAAAAAVACGPAEGSSQRPSRVYADLAIGDARPIWIRSDKADTTLIFPNRSLLAHNRVFVTDPGGPAVSALDAATGATEWRYARQGSGPGELKSPQLLAWHPDGLVVADNENRRLYLFDIAGHLLHETKAPHGLGITAMCSFSDGRVLVNVAVMTGTSLYVTDFVGSDPEPLALPFDTASGSPLDRAVDLASAAPSDVDGCVGTRKTNRGMALLRETGPPVLADYVETVVQRPYKPPQLLNDTTDLPIPFSRRAGVTDGHVWVWFGGESCASRCIDFYRLPGLRYEYSLRLTGRKTGLGLYDLAIANNRMVVLGSRDGAPLIAMYRLPASP